MPLQGPGTAAKHGKESELNATHQNLSLLHQLGQLGLRILALAAVAGCTLLGYGVYRLVSDTGFGGLVWEVYTDASAAAGAMFGMHPIVASLILPALITSSLALAGVYYMYKRT